MTQKIGSNADFNPKHRIVGAIIVVSLAVIFVPMILDEREPPARRNSIVNVPEQSKTENGADTKVVVVPIEPLKTSALSKRQESSIDHPIEAAIIASNIQVEKSARRSVDSAASATRAAPAPTPKSAAPDPGWIVQVGTFANLSNASRLRDKLKTSGYSVDEEKITLEGNKAVRLRVGPFQNKPAAIKARADIQNDLGVQGVVLANP